MKHRSEGVAYLNVVSVLVTFLKLDLGVVNYYLYRLSFLARTITILRL